MADDLDARTEPAGRKQQDEAQRSGSLAPSRTLLAAASTGAALLVLGHSLPATFVTVRDLFRGTLLGRLPLSSWGPRWEHALVEALLLPMAAVLLAAFGVGLWATRARLVGWSVQSPGRRTSFGASLGQAALYALLAFGTIALTVRFVSADFGGWVAHAPALPLARLAWFLGRGLRGLTLGLAAGCLGLVFWELVRHERRRRQALFVTPREAREQMREEEGAPMVRAAQRARQQETAKELGSAAKWPEDGRPEKAQ